MQIISFFMSLVMSVVSLFTPVCAINEKYDTAQKIENVFELLIPDDGTVNSETREILLGILTNIITEGINGESEAEDVIALIDRFPVYEKGERDAERLEIKVSPFKKAFSSVAASVIGNVSLPDGVKMFVDLVVNGIYDMYIYLTPTDEENVYAFCYDLSDNFGNIMVVETKMRINKATGQFYNEDGKGMLGSGYDYNAYEYLVTTPVDVWMRTAGYTILFDIVGNMGFINCDTARIEFEHEGKYWMFQLWKGNYAFDLLNGCEIGIYNKTEKYGLMYDCASDDEMLNMSMKLKHGDDIIIEREKALHWWLCSMQFGNHISPDELVMESTVEFNDAEMMNKFVEATEKYSDEMTVSVSGNEVSVIWK